MTGRDEHASWIVAVLLLVAAVGIGWMAWRGPAAPVCAIPPSPASLRSFATADVLDDRTVGNRHGILALYEAGWRPADSPIAWSTVQLLVSAERSDFVIPPNWILPDVPLSNDVLDTGTLDGASGEVPFHLRTNATHPVPYALGWIYALDDEPITNPLAHLTRRAFAHPLEPAPPLVLISADSKLGSLSMEARTELVRRRLQAAWRDWEAACGT